MLEGRLIRRKFSRGETIFSEGDPATGLWIVDSGRISIVREALEGMPLITEAFGRCEAFCPLPLLDGKPYPCTAVAATECVLYYLPARDFLSVMKGSSGLTQSTMGFVADRLRYYEARHAGGRASVPVRVARALLEYREKFGDTVRITRAELAQMAGTTMESAYRVTSKFSRAGIIKTGRGSITILKPDKLSRLSQG